MKLEAGALKLALATATAVALACTGLPAAAQPTSDAARVDAVRQQLATDKRALVEKNMDLTPDEARRFWPLYESYQRDLAPITQRQNRAVLDYVNAESSMTDGNAKRIAREVMESDAAEQKLREKHYKKLLTALPARKAVRYLQIENKIRALNRFDMAERISLIR